MPFARDWEAPVTAPTLVREDRYDWRLILLLTVVALVLILALIRRRRQEDEPVAEPVPEVVASVEPEEEIIERQLTPEEEQRLRVRRKSSGWPMKILTVSPA